MNLRDGTHRRLASSSKTKRLEEHGFTLVETAIALLIMMIASLGAAFLFAYSINNNSGANDRAQALVRAQQRLEQLRDARFAATATDTLLAGGTTTLNVDSTGTTPCGSGQRCYTVETVIDDDPSTPDTVDVSSASRFKSIRVSVTPQGAGPAWARGAGGRVTLVTQRARVN